MIDFNYRQYIKGIMDAMETNLAIVELRITLNKQPIYIKGNYKLFVTKENENQDLKFFSITTGIQYRRLTEHLSGDIEFIALHTLEEYNIAEYVNRQEKKHD